MSRTVSYDTNGNEIYEDASSYTQEQLKHTKKREAVDHPDYYKTGGIEAIDVIEAWNLGFCLGNTIKYISRAGRKSNKVIEDLEKAAWYLNREIERTKTWKKQQKSYKKKCR